MRAEREYEVMALRAQRLAAVGKNAQAEALLRQGQRQAEADRNEPFAHCFRGSLARLKLDLEAYLEEQREAVHLHPHSPFLNVALGRALNWRDRYEEALDAFDRALRIEPNYQPALRSRAVALNNCERYEEALDAVNAAASVYPGDPELLGARALVLLNLGKLDDALAAADESLAALPNYIMALRVRAGILTKMGRYEDAGKCLESAEALSPNSPMTQEALGGLRLFEGRPLEALDAFQRALEVVPWSPDLRTKRAIVLDVLGRTGEAMGELRQLVAERPQDERAKAWLFRFEEPQQAQAIDEERQEERRRRQQQERERQIKLDAWRRLSGRTAHRVDNQLFAAKGALRALKARTDPELSEPVLDIEGCLDRIARICSEFRRFSTEQPPKLKTTDARLLIQDAARRYSKLAEGIDIREELAPLLPECAWDAQQIEQAISELLENAIRHTPKGKNIVVKAEPKEKHGKQHVRLVVRNDGEGIEARYKDRLFDPFFSLRPGGTGLGLAIVAQIIQNHGGTIRETGEPGQFARFEVELPAQPSKEDSHESSDH